MSHLANVLGDQSFLDSLLARKCLFYDQYDTLLQCCNDRKPPEEVARTLLRFLRRRPPSIFDSFCDILQEKGRYDDRKSSLYRCIVSATSVARLPHENSPAHEDRPIARHSQEDSCETPSKNDREAVDISASAQVYESCTCMPYGNFPTHEDKTTSQCGRKSHLGTRARFTVKKDCDSSDTLSASARADSTTISERVNSR